ncbi:DUF4388 domain-containing protein [Candidatus Sumerlaeota bacterium]|nr:DUF4388 domain-containing protein [Candidatus Sumerlaeota bacterium]
MQGNLKQIQLPEVLQFISMGKSTGLLSIRGQNETDTTLTIRRGKIINSSALERQRRLGDILVHRGILKRSVLTQVLALQRTAESDKRLGQILAERDIVPDSTIREVLRLQLEEEIWNLFGLEEGEFRFETIEDERIGEATLHMDIEPLLLEGTRRQDEWRKIARLLPSDRLVPAMRADFVANTEDDRFRVPPVEWRVLAQINGQFPIRAVINRSGLGRFEVYQILATLLNRNVIEIKKEDVADPSHATQQLPPQAGAATGAPPSTSVRGVGGFLSRLTGAGKTTERQEVLSFVTPLGSIAYFINRMVEGFFTMREMKPQGDDQRIAEMIWPDLLVSCCKADVIRISGNTVNTDYVEKFIKMFEFGEATRDVYEDGVEALSQLLDAMYRVFSNRVGERNASKLIRDLLGDIGPRVTHTYNPEFRLDERVQHVLRLAA